jgi:NADH:ubiquinone oxidoreductase subunit 6 (subunit J)
MTENNPYFNLAKDHAISHVSKETNSLFIGPVIIMLLIIAAGAVYINDVQSSHPKSLTDTKLLVETNALGDSLFSVYSAVEYPNVDPLTTFFLW